MTDTVREVFEAMSSPAATGGTKAARLGKARETGAGSAKTSPANQIGAEPYVYADQIGHLLRRAYQRHLAIFQEAAAEFDLTSTQFVALCALRDNGPGPQIGLIQATGIDQATIRGIVERLGKRGLVEFRTDHADRRKTIVAATPAGLALLDRMIPRARTVSELTMGDLNPAERLAILYTLRRMVGQPG
jgi:DNA-binding MarR family transcriptional regulator